MNQDNSTSNDNGVNDQVIADLRKKYDADPMSVPEDWRVYFAAVIAQEKASATPAETTVTETNTEAAASQAATDAARSDLPPAPRSKVEPPTSPYAHLKEVLAADGDHVLPEEDIVEKLRGPKGAVVKNMDKSLTVPTATSARQVQAKLLIENRAVINQHLARTRGGKVSFTHLIAYAIIEALVAMPSMNVRFEEVDGKPAMRQYAHVGLGLAIDLPKADGSRMLMVPVIKETDRMNFQQFLDAYADVLNRARKGQLTPDDFVGASATLTNPGMIGTTHSVPRLMAGQGVIIGVGATDYPAEWAGASEETLAENAIGKIMTITSTYDHRIIQGAGSGEFLKIVNDKLIGLDGFYDRVFAALEVPYEPYRWSRDIQYDDKYQKGKRARITQLIHSYRSRGHLIADIDPLSYRARRHPDLTLEAYGLSIWDLDREYPTGNFSTKDRMKLRDIINQLRDTYTRTVGIEYMHIQDPEQRVWMQDRIEHPWEKPAVETQLHVLSKLNHAEAFETFLHTKYVGQKRFSLEGGESLIPLLDRILFCAAHDGMGEVSIGMAHRGRLNVLANIAGKSYGQIFSEFEGNMNPAKVHGSGDVKYHLGTEGIYTSDDGVATKVSLVANPSHLEAADPVLEGVVRAKQDVMGGYENTVMPILIHGDAAFIGQGVVFETLNMSQVAAYRTGGTVHIIVNNQIGFTTSPTSGRSTNYCTDLAKGLQVPIFHVNGDDPEMVARIGKLAFDFRQKFHKDVIIDMVCYRRRGHNEGDDPSMTQPVMYAQIDSLPTTRAVYAKNLIGRGDLTEEDARAALKEYNDELDKILAETREHGWQPNQGEVVSGLEKPESQHEGVGDMIGWKSAIDEEVMHRIGDAHVQIPEGFTPHPKMKKLLEKRQEMSRKGGIDWGFGELLAFGSLLMEGTPVRMSGEDVWRGTFVSRHAVMHDHETGDEWTPLKFLTEGQAAFEIYNSTLSEYAPMGFEYGYSVERPEALVLWEAQFGDFANGAQTIMDEFISSAEQKWNQHSSVVLLLPHGFEGQGPDHSSARIERYLTLCAEDNMWVCQPSTPANHFHMLRNQAYRRPRKPLIVFTPKQLLRLPAAASSVEDFTKGEFQPVIGEVNPAIADNPGNVNRVIMCSGRVYYDLAKHRDKIGDTQTAILRLEQFYPLDEEAIAKAVAPYGDAEVVWVQDEPANQGAWPFLAMNFTDAAFGGRRPRLVSRPAAASPAAGTAALHKAQNAKLMEEAFAR